MNFLQLAQRLRREAGLSGSGPTATSNQTGEMLRIVEWVRDAYLDIQNAQPAWNWLHKTDVVAVVAAKQTYSPALDWGIAPLKYQSDSFWIYAASDGPSFGMPMTEDDYSKIRQYSTAPVARPTSFIAMPNRDIKLNTIPDQDYALTLDYYAIAESLALDTDVPSMPEQYHMAIVWKALQYYADYEEIPYLRQSATLKYMAIHDQMLRTESPQIRFGGALA